MAKYTNIRERRETDRFGNVLIYVGDRVIRVEDGTTFEAITMSGAYTSAPGPSVQQTGQFLDDEVMRILLQLADIDEKP